MKCISGSINSVSLRLQYIGVLIAHLLFGAYIVQLFCYVYELRRTTPRTLTLWEVAPVKFTAFGSRCKAVNTNGQYNGQSCTHLNSAFFTSEFSRPLTVK
ncbi:hypothetical protein CC2G_014362 [Coprinopsis cinerea AmutBmut pab1-1]|nr:hypothetical protein CC2G_014362 [Coprinopsis cinerea AmutBmut pab1-1]